jgi:VanZ family protein
MHFSFYNSKLYSRTALCLLFIYLLATLYLATSEGNGFFLASLWDKFKHTASFFVLYILLDIAFCKRHPILLFVLSFLYGVGIEIVQIFLPYRDSSFLDVLANLLGTFSAMWLLTKMKKKGTYKREVT